MKYSKDDPSNLKEVFKEINKAYGVDTVSFADDNAELNIEVWDTTCYSLNHVLGNGGLAKGRVYEFFGAPSCLSGDTKINFAIKDKDGKKINNKGGTLDVLYRRFHNIKIGTCGEHFMSHKDLSFTVASVDENGYIFHNPIHDVVKCGMKECYEVETMSGKKIICTKEHQFMTEDNIFKPIGKLFAGDIVFISSNIYEKHGRAKRVHDEGVCIKYHPYGSRKYVTDSKRSYKYKYDRVPKSHLAYEATLNGLSYEEYKEALNTLEPSKIKKMKFLAKGMQIHHKDKNHYNNDPSNLLPVTASEHSKLHSTGNKYLKLKVVPDRINSIRYFGEIETYDIKCLAPYNNYVANGIVVHNSGKTTAALHILSKIQKQGGKVAFIDAEFAFNADHARKIGVNTKELIFVQPINGEEAFGTIEKLIHTGEVAAIVVDSTAALVPTHELEGEITDHNVALQARMISKGLRMITGAVAKTKTIIIFISQVRSKIGHFIGPTSESSGGNALKFYASVRLEVHKIKTLKKAEKVIGNRLKIVAVKNKVASPFGEAEVDLYFDSGFDLYGEALEYGEKIGIVNKSGITYLIDGEKIGAGKDNARLFLISHNDIYEKLRRTIEEAEAKKDKPEDGVAKNEEEADDGESPKRATISGRTDKK